MADGRTTGSGAHCRARENARRPKEVKLRRGPLERYVSRHLAELWSPREICERLALDYPNDAEMRVSHETIYQSLFVQGRGELKRELARCLRTGRTRRKSQGRQHRRGKIPDGAMISERLAEVADRAVPGHRGVMSSSGSVIAARWARWWSTSRFILLLHLPHGHTAEAVEAATGTAIRRLPTELCRSVT